MSTVFCKHFRSMSEHKTCSAGVAYESLKGTPSREWPCWMRHGQTFPGCEKQDMPSPEEIDAEEREWEEHSKRIVTARSAIVAHLGGPWKRGMQGSHGTIDCPVCKGVQSLRFRRAGYNGHIHASCSTTGCVSWME